MNRRAWGPSPLMLAAAACLVLAGASLALPSGPGYDEYSWLIWGRELAHLQLSLLGTGTSWKPFTALVAVPLAALGSHSAEGWLVLARAGGLFAACVAFALAWRLAPAVRWLAAAVAAATVLLTQHWVSRTGTGAAEGLMVGLALLAIVRHLDGHRAQAFWLVVVACLIRVEMWPFAFVYGWWLSWHGGRRRAIAAGLALIPLLWFGGDWIGSGTPLRAASLADRPLHGSLAYGQDPAVAVLHEALTMVPPAAWFAVALAIGWALLRRETVVLWLAAGALAWTAIVVVMTIRGYPGEDRFLFMATSLEALLAGIGCAVAAFGVRAVAVRLAQPTRVATGLATLVVAVGFAAGSAAQARELPTAFTDMAKMAQLDERVASTVQASGGAAALDHCAELQTYWYTVPALAYDLNVPALDVEKGAKTVLLPAPPCQAAASSPQPGRS